MSNLYPHGKAQSARFKPLPVRSGPNAAANAEKAREQSANAAHSYVRKAIAHAMLPAHAVRLLENGHAVNLGHIDKGKLLRKVKKGAIVRYRVE